MPVFANFVRRAARAFGQTCLTWVCLPVLLAACGTSDSAPTGAGRPPASGAATLTVAVAGLPSGAGAAISVTGPAGYSHSISASETLAALAAGQYAITATEVNAGADRFGASLASQSVTLSAGSSNGVTVAYAILSGSIAVNVAGLPGGAAADLTLSGPAGFSSAITSSVMVGGLVPGAYTLTSAPVLAGGFTYAPAAARADLDVAASSSSTPASVTYALASGAVSVTSSGLPAGVSATAMLSGLNDFRRSVAVGSLVTNVPSGSYTLTADPVVSGADAYRVVAPVALAVEASTTPVHAMLEYALASGGLALTVSGLPNGALAGITVTGPGSFHQSVTASTLLPSLTPGTYTVAAAVVQSGASSWGPNPASQTVAVPASTSAITAQVTYATAVGTLAVTVNGLPGGVNAGILVTGPNAYSHSVPGSQTLSGLLQGLYNVSASTVSSSGTTYTPTAATQTMNVGGGVTSSVSVTYSASGGPPPPPPGLNLTIDGLQVQQAVQTYAGAVPLVAGRDGLLRVFVKASQGNTAAPAVRVRFYTGGSLTKTVTIVAPSSSTPTTVDESTLNSSWNYLIPGALVQPGMTMLADVDPTNAVAESSESDNSFPVSGTATALDVRSVSTFNVRFVPVTQSVNGLTGGVTAGNVNQYLADTKAMWPLGSVDVDVRAPFTTSAPVLQSDDADGAWGQILSEINALRTADGSTRYYYGVVRVGYLSGIAGLGYVPGRASIGWDNLPSASGVAVHEFGHNFGRFHAPCGGAGSPDPAYPYSGGKIGVYGYDLSTSTLKAPPVADLMGYCSGSWVSDYNYTAVLNYRAANPFSASSALGGTYARRGLLVWGRVHEGQLTLEPAYEVDAAPALPSHRGSQRLQAFGPLGEQLLDLSFEGEHPADAKDPGDQHFAFVVPLEALRGVLPARLRYSARGRQAELTSTALATPASAVRAEQAGRGAVRVLWPDATTRGVLIRDARSGEILAFGRGGSAVVYTNAGDVDVTVSDGVRSTRQRIGISAGGAPPRR